MRLWLRVALGVAFVSVIALLVTGAVAVEVAASSATRAAVEAQERDASAMASTVGRWLEEQGDVLLGWALAFPVADFDEARRQGLARAVLAGVPSTVVVVLVDGDGVLVTSPAYFATGPTTARDWTPGSAAMAARLVEDLPLTAALEDPRGVAFGEPRPGDAPTVPLAVVASREPPLVLGAEISLAVADELAAATGPGRAVVLVDAHGHGVAGGSHPLVDLERVRPLLGTLANFEYERDARVVRGAVAPAGASGWSVLVLEPEEVALRGANGIWWRIVPVVAGAMVLSILAGLALGRTVTDPLARLRDSVQALTEGRYGATAEVGRADEVGELAVAFNTMSGRLRDNQDEITRQREEIEAFNRDLQARVDAATRDLREAQEQLVRSGQLAAVAQIGAGLAHELNNPLMAVLGLAQVLDARGEGPEVRRAAADLVAEAGRCREVVDTLLRFTEGPAHAASEAGDLTTMLGELRAAVGSTVRRRGVALVWGDAPAVRVRMDPAAGVRALGALVTALAAGLGDGARITVSAAVEGPSAVVRVAPDRPVGEGQDGWMASGLDVWVARQTLEGLGGRLAEPVLPQTAWCVRIPLALPAT